ncbi:hypothetical protein C0J52_01958 [Blattella germanica]|nr:hypothetical protein C0J52_01958 [Blattella germanica]
MQGGCRTAAPPTIVLYSILHFIGFRFKTRSHIKIVFYTNQIQSNFILRSARTLLLVQQATDVLMPFPPPLDSSTFYDSNTRAFSLPLLSCGRYRTVFSAAKELFGCRLCLSRARAISVKCFEVHVFIYSDQMVSSIFIYITCIYLYLNYALCSPPKCYFFESPLNKFSQNHKCVTFMNVIFIN